MFTSMNSSISTNPVADFLRPRMIVFAMCAGCLSRERAVGEAIRALDYRSARVIGAYPTPTRFRRLPKASLEGHSRLRSGHLNAHGDHLNAPNWDQKRSVSHSAPADIPCAANAPDLGQGLRA
jgi:hypothetical protein